MSVDCFYLRSIFLVNKISTNQSNSKLDANTKVHPKMYYKSRENT